MIVGDGTHRHDDGVGVLSALSPLDPVRRDCGNGYRRTAVVGHDQPFGDGLVEFGGSSAAQIRVQLEQQPQIDIVRFGGAAARVLAASLPLLF